MGGKREKTTVKKMRRIALVICEGETEHNYVNIIKNWYKSPVKIVSHIEGSKIKQELIDKHTRELKISKEDKIDTFLMYDMDVTSINKKLQTCKAELLLSNPCFEIWILLHVKTVKNSMLNSNEVIEALKKSANTWNNYNKSKYTETQKTYLKNNVDNAISRAKQLKEFQNTSSTVYKLIEKLKE